MAQLPTSSAVTKEIISACRDLPSGWPIGFEQYLIDEDADFGSYPVAPVPKDLPWLFSASRPPEASFYADRPRSELAAFKAWEYVDSRLTPEALTAIHKAFGLSGQFRSCGSNVLIASDGSRLRYLDEAHLDERLGVLLKHIDRNEFGLDPFYLAITALFDFLLIHPFDDGNGRMARLLFQWILARYGILSRPVLPLLPAIRKGRAPFLLALYNWEFGNDPLPLIRFVDHAVRPTLQCLRHFTAGRGLESR